MTALPESEWRQDSGLTRIVRTLSDGAVKPFAVGGAVRDSILGLAVSDVDLTTPLHPDEVIRRLETAGIKVIPTGIDHGTVTAVAGAKNYEITTFRRDVSTDGRHATVAFSNDWREDAQRRDFTINALFADVSSGEIFDCTGGLADLDRRYVRFIGSAADRIAEDHLRILRYFRFLARFGEGQVDDEALSACCDAANSLKSLSRERIASELTRLMVLPDPQQSVQLMAANGIFAAFLPECVPNANERLARLIGREAEQNQPPSIEARLLTLLPNDAATIEKVARRLKLSNRLRKALVARVQTAEPGPNDMRFIAYRHGAEAARDAALLFSADGQIASCLTAIKGWEKPEFPMKGSDLISMGLKAGPIVSATLEVIRAEWIAENFPNAARVDELARKALG